jgi:outer membrane lipoprotein SlyB
MRTHSRWASLGLSIVLAAALSACVNQPRREYRAAQPYPQHPQAHSAPQGVVEYGTVSRIEALPGGRGGQTSGAGAVLGAVVGGLLGNQVGKGGGRAAATMAGVVGGAVAGNAIEERNSRPEHYRITIRLNRGGQRAYDVDSYGDLRTGDRVRLRGGEIARM